MHLRFIEPVEAKGEIDDANNANATMQMIRFALEEWPQTAVEQMAEHPTTVRRSCKNVCEMVAAISLFKRVG